jgi:hypothetical protein
MDHVDLCRRLADRAVASHALSLDDRVERTDHAHEQHGVGLEAGRQVRQPARLEQHVIDDHRQPCVRQRGDHPVETVDQPVAELAGLDPEWRRRARLS